MIPRAYINEWRSSAPWISDAQVEQDLIICRTLVELFSHHLINETLAFRGGTALHKLYLLPASRYSEDIDLVQIQAGPAGHLMDAVQDVLNPLLGKPSRSQKESSIILTYKTESEIPPVQPIRLKIEVNTREHFSVYGIVDHRYSVSSQWFSKACSIKTYSLNELLGTKLRALYQRRKGRELYDLWLGITRGGAEPTKIVNAFNKYLASENHRVSHEEYRHNLEEKMGRRDFMSDTDSLLQTETDYDPQKAFKIVCENILTLIY